jgi:glycosyltransferase involved in cell wall biosynthesis
MPPRIGVDARAAAEVPAGRGRYVREIVRAMQALDADLRLYARTAWPLSGTRWRLIGTRDPLWGAHAAFAAGRECDVLLASNSYLMTVGRVPTVPVVFDMFGSDRAHGLPPSALAERMTLPIAVGRAAGFICISDATRRALEERFPATRGRAVTIPLGAAAAFYDATPGGTAERYGLEPGYVLAVGTLEPRKNLPRLVEAFVSLPEPVRDGRSLVLAGGRGWSTAELDAMVGRHRDHVRVLGFVPDEELPGLLAGAAVFAYPSLAEGYGLPVAEAMAAGAPVLTSNRSSLPEVAGDAAVLVDPTDVDAISAGLERLLADEGLRRELAERGRRRAAGLTWEHTARRTLDYLGTVAR